MTNFVFFRTTNQTANEQRLFTLSQLRLLENKNKETIDKAIFVIRHGNSAQQIGLAEKLAKKLKATNLFQIVEHSHEIRQFLSQPKFDYLWDELLNKLNDYMIIEPALPKLTLLMGRIIAGNHQKWVEANKISCPEAEELLTEARSRGVSNTLNNPNILENIHFAACSA